MVRLCWAFAFHQDKASLVRVPVAKVTMSFSWSGVPIGIVSFAMDTTEILEFKTSRDRYRDNGVSDPIGGLVFKGSSGTGSLPSGRVDLIGDKDPTDEDGDIRMEENLSFRKTYWELLPKEILGAITQRHTGSYYPKRYWELLPKEILGAITQRETGMSYGKMEVT
ncbi:hypothetical protein Tco_0633286 [Tanacetum coccineum]